MPYKMNGFPQLGGDKDKKPKSNINKKFIKGATTFPQTLPNGYIIRRGEDDKKTETLESKINAALGNLKEKAIRDVNARYTEDGQFPEGRDRARHMTTSQYYTEAIKNKLDMIPFSNSAVNRFAAAGITNVLGAAHEIKAGYANIKKGKPISDTIIETAEDMTNNFAGSIVGAMGGNKAEKRKIVDNKKLKSMLPDGIYRKKGDNTYNKNKK